MNLKPDTVINLLIVMIIPLAILVLFIVPTFMDRSDEAKILKVKFDISHIEEVLTKYQQDHGKYPSTEEGLILLVKTKNPKGEPYLSSFRVDPWGREYKYRFPGLHNKNKYDLWSFGADNKQNGSDKNQDIKNWDINK